MLAKTKNPVNGHSASAALNTLLSQDWSFADLKRTDTLWGPHGYHRYPAKFIPQLVRRIIELYSEPHAVVGDPFLGSATTGVEALRANRRFWGADINPVALLISQAKCTPINPRKLNHVWEELSQSLERTQRIGRRSLTQAEKELITKIDIARASDQERLAYWFPKPHTRVLDKILERILEVPGQTTRTFFLCAFSNILRRCSIWLSGSTKPQKDLEKTLSDPVEAFQLQVRDMLRRNQLYWEDLTQAKISLATLSAQYHLTRKDARHLPLADGELDLLVSSPPYATCYEYTEIHQLTQLWLEKYQLITSHQWRHVCIGSKHVSDRQRRNGNGILATGSPTIDLTLNTLEALQGPDNKDARREAAALRYYFYDMQMVLQEFARIVATGKRMVLIVGDSRKRGIDIPTSAALCEIASTVGFELEKKIVRKIPVRILVVNRDEKTGRFSPTAQSDTQVYPEEDILIFKRQP